MASVKEQIITGLNKLVPSFNRILIIGNKGLACNAVELANYISDRYDFPVYFAVSDEFRPYAKELLSPNIRLVAYSRNFFQIVILLCRYFSSKYIFSTHGYNYGSSKEQMLINVWHGAGHKRIRLLRGDSGVPADMTVATSKLSKEMFSKFFGVPVESIFISGYPRNDLMLRAKQDNYSIKTKMNPSLNDYDKVLFWMPTFRRSSAKSTPKVEGLTAEKIFHIKNFNINQFNAILKKHNTLCLVKPHYLYLFNDEIANLNNVKSIDDEWIHKQGITLYHLLACTDALITDYSSVMIDYTLLEQPIFCLATDLEEFKKTQGLYFDDYENWVPTKLLQKQADFFDALEKFLSTGKDPHEVKRKKIRDLYFKYQDANSAQRIAEYVLGPPASSTVIR
jgi:CDP-glycerol glycerophosphotransferase (TagB/SpsB family)